MLMTSPTEEPTLASMWCALAGISITDEFLEWPPDLFALTDVILKRSEVYRFILSPHPGMEWPPTRFDSWTDAIDEAALHWSECVEDPGRGLPILMRQEWGVLREGADVPLAHFA